MKLVETEILGCYELQPNTWRDHRGSFVKNFHEREFKALGLETQFPEEFYTRSAAGVLRGLHFMSPPCDQIKVVTCVFGRVLDAFVDLRRGSPSFGKYVLKELNDELCNILYLEKGIAHGFYVPSGEAILAYRVSTMHSPPHDHGIRWDSAGIPWPTSSPIISDRDMSLPLFQDFQSPFEYERDYMGSVR